jgi:hypothetical protein
MVATNSHWIQQFIPPPHPINHILHHENEHIPTHDTLGRALALAILPEQTRGHKPPIGKVLTLGSVIPAGGENGDMDLLDGKIPESIVAVLLLHGHIKLAYDNSSPQSITAPSFSVPAKEDDHNCFISLGEINDTAKPTLFKAGPGSVLLMLSADEIDRVHDFAKKITKNASLKTPNPTSSLPSFVEREGDESSSSTIGGMRASYASRTNYSKKNYKHARSSVS